MSMQDFIDKQEENIKKYGLSIVCTGTETIGNKMTSMAYTVGLSDNSEMSEIIVFGLPQDTAVKVLNLAADKLREGTAKPDELLTEICNLSMVLKVVPKSIANEYTLQARYRAKRDVPVMQLVWPDRNGKFPWEDNYKKEFLAHQPNLFILN